MAKRYSSRSEETEKVRTTTVENLTKNNSVEKEPRRDNVTHDANPSSVLEKHSNEENHSSSNLKESMEAVRPTTSEFHGIDAGSSRVEKGVGSNTDSITTLNATTRVGGER